MCKAYIPPLYTQKKTASISARVDICNENLFKIGAL